MRRSTWLTTCRLSPDREAFIFNGELHGVAIQAEGGIGAEKLFHFLQRFDGDDRDARLCRALDIVKRKTRYVRAMNFVLADSRRPVRSRVLQRKPGLFHAAREKGRHTLFGLLGTVSR